MSDMVSFNLRLPAGLCDNLKAVADTHGVSVTYLLRQWIKLGFLLNEVGNEFTIRTPEGEKHVKVI